MEKPKNQFSKWVPSYSPNTLPNGQSVPCPGAYFARDSKSEGLGYPNIFTNQDLTGNVDVEVLPTAATFKTKDGLKGISKKSLRAIHAAWTKPKERIAFYKEAPYLFNLRIITLRDRFEELLTSASAKKSEWSELSKLLDQILKIFEEDLKKEYFTESLLPFANFGRELLKASEEVLNVIDVSSEAFSVSALTPLLKLKYANAYIASILKSNTYMGLPEQIVFDLLSKVKTKLMLSGIPDHGLKDLVLDHISQTITLPHKPAEAGAIPNLQSANTSDEFEPEEDFDDEDDLIPTGPPTAATGVTSNPAGNITTEQDAPPPPLNPQTPAEESSAQSKLIPEQPRPRQPEIKLSSANFVVGIEVGGLTLAETLFMMGLAKKKIWTKQGLEVLANTLNLDSKAVLLKINLLLQALGQPSLIETNLEGISIIMSPPQLDLTTLLKDL